MNFMTREDMLRELELLPVWQLRTPLPAKLEQVDVKITAEIAKITPPTEAPVIAEPQVFSYIASEDGLYLLVLENVALSADEARLLQNICQAMRIKTKAAVTSANTTDIVQTNQTRLVIAMGEAAAQGVLQSADSLDNLRGKLHVLAGVKPEVKADVKADVKIVATYDVGHLLQNLPDKAKTWDDLCLAMQALQSW
jgi:DNA polymerase